MKNSKNNRLLPILFGVFLLLFVAMIVALCIPKAAPKGEFVPPDFDAAAVSGVPEVAQELCYEELYREGMAYRVSICGVPTVEQGSLTVYFTNTESNEKYMKLRILDEKGNILGETGLLRPGEYLQSVALSEDVPAGTQLKLKIMGYEPEDYSSAGSVSLNVTVGGTAS